MRGHTKLRGFGGLRRGSMGERVQTVVEQKAFGSLQDRLTLRLADVVYYVARPTRYHFIFYKEIVYTQPSANRTAELQLMLYVHKETKARDPSVSESCRVIRYKNAFPQGMLREAVSC